jgi:hypothetical protein
MSNANEDFAGTDPLDVNSTLRVLNLTTDKWLTWSSVTGRNYQVLVSTNIGGVLIPASGVIPAAGAATTYLDSMATNAQRIYRVTVLP